MTTALAPSDAPGPGQAPLTGADPAHWLLIAREVADDLAIDAAARERAGRAPFDEVSRLREAGLLTLLAPARRGGAGADWRTAYAVVRTVAAADGAIAQLLGCHYFLSSSARFFARPSLAARLERRAAGGAWCWGGGFAALDAAPVLTPAADGFRLDGRQSYAAGARVADRLAVRAVRSDTGEPLAVHVDAAHPSVRRTDADEPFGLRLAAGGTVEFDAVPVPAGDVLGSLSADDGVLSPYAGLAVPVARLMSAQFCLGVAEGLLAEAREYRRVPRTQAGREPHPYAPGEPRPYEPRPYEPRLYEPQPYGPADVPDPGLLAAYGELAVSAHSASALAEQAVTALTHGLARGDDLDDEAGAEIAVLAAAAEVAASRAARDITSGALDVIGDRAASARLGLDRFWRNARTHMLREPVTHRLREVGDYFLNGAHPSFALPT